MSNDVAKILDDAINTLETGGWAQDMFENHFGEHCLIGAVRSSCVNKHPIHLACEVCSSYEILKPIGRVLGEEDPSFYSFLDTPEFIEEKIFVWNDDPKRTKEDVVLVLKQARELAIGY